MGLCRGQRDLAEEHLVIQQMEDPGLLATLPAIHCAAMASEVCGTATAPERTPSTPSIGTAQRRPADSSRISVRPADADALSRRQVEDARERAAGKDLPAKRRHAQQHRAAAVRDARYVQHRRDRRGDARRQRKPQLAELEEQDRALAKRDRRGVTRPPARAAPRGSPAATGGRRAPRRGAGFGGTGVAASLMRSPSLPGPRSAAGRRPCCAARGRAVPGACAGWGARSTGSAAAPARAADWAQGRGPGGSGAPPWPVRRAGGVPARASAVLSQREVLHVRLL